LWAISCTSEQAVRCLRWIVYVIVSHSHWTCLSALLLYTVEKFLCNLYGSNDRGKWWSKSIVFNVWGLCLNSAKFMAQVYLWKQTTKIL
jgi:hypothetical protein